MNPRLAWPTVALAGLGAVVAGVMAIMHVSADTIALVASLMIVPVLTAFLAGQISEIKGQSNQIMANTNGNLARLVDIIERQSQQLAAAQPPPVQDAPPEQQDKLAA